LTDLLKSRMRYSRSTLNDRLIIFTHVLHYRVGDKVVAHGPYVNEINELAKRVPEVVIVGPLVLQTESISPDNIPYVKTPRIISLPVVGGNSVLNKLSYLWYGPVLIFQLLKGIRTPGTLHPRAPGSVALLAMILIALVGRKKKKFAKFAGEWDSPRAMPTTFRWQRNWLIKKWLFNGPVFVYTSLQNPSHVIPSFTSNLRQEEIVKANMLGVKKQLDGKLILAVAGRLVKNKGVDVLLQALAIVNKASTEWELLIMGDGLERDTLQKQAEDLGIAKNIKWLGWCSQESMRLYFQQAHIICQPTRFTESWGKVLQEGMVYGCIPVASAIGGLQRQLASRPELLFEPGNAAQCGAIIGNIVTGKLNYETLKNWSIVQSELYSLNALVDFTCNKYNEYYPS